MDPKNLARWVIKGARKSSSSRADPDEAAGYVNPAPIPYQATPAGPPGPAPQGYGWTIISGQYVLVQLPPNPYVLPPQAPPGPPAGSFPYYQQPAAGMSPQPSPQAYEPPGGDYPTSTCLLVKEDARDPYVEFLATLPDLMPHMHGYNPHRPVHNANLGGGHAGDLRRELAPLMAEFSEVAAYQNDDIRVPRGRVPGLVPTVADKGQNV